MEFKLDIIVNAARAYVLPTLLRTHHLRIDLFYRNYNHRIKIRVRRTDVRVYVSINLHTNYYGLWVKEIPHPRGSSLQPRKW